MKSFVLLCIGFFILVGFTKLTYRLLDVKIEEQSKISIKGTSNVNTFHCAYQEELELQNNTIELLPHHNSFEIKKAKIQLDAESFDCGGRRINRDFKNLLKTEQFPNISIEIHSITPYQNGYLADVKVHIAGQVKLYQLNVENPKNNQFTGELIIDIEEFGLESPKKLMGLIEVNNLIDINFDLYLDVKA